MVLNLDNDVFIDMDKVSAVVPADKFVVVDGVLLNILKDDYIVSIADVFKWQHQDHTYDKNLKKIPIEKRGKK